MGAKVVYIHRRGKPGIMLYMFCSGCACTLAFAYNSLFSVILYIFMQYMDYRNGYHKDHPVIKLFWTVFYDLPLESKKKFLGAFIYV